jgi:hypothetical protein
MRPFLELIGRLRSEVPRREVAAGAALWFGIACFGLVGWNLLVAWVMPLDMFPVQFDRASISIAAVLIVLSGVVSLMAAWMLRSQVAQGAWWAKVAVWSFAGALGGIVWGLWTNTTFLGPPFFTTVGRTMFTLVLSQFAVAGWFVLGYLDRLAAAHPEGAFAFGVSQDDRIPSPAKDSPYREGPFPWSVQVTFLVSTAGFVGTVLVLQKLFGLDWAAWVAVPGLLVLFVGPFAWNERKSSFEREREVLATYRVGLSLLLFNATVPFCKVLVYRDGVEIRVQYTRFFLPYDRLTSPPSLEGILSGTVVFKSRLPGVPESILIHSSKASGIVARIEGAREGQG